MTETDITIPREAMKAAYSAFAAAMGDDEPALEAACLAMLRNWPGVQYTRRATFIDGTERDASITLPLTQESS